MKIEGLLFVHLKIQTLNSRPFTFLAKNKEIKFVPHLTPLCTIRGQRTRSWVHFFTFH